MTTPSPQRATSSSRVKTWQHQKLRNNKGERPHNNHRNVKNANRRFYLISGFIIVLLSWNIVLHIKMVDRSGCDPLVETIHVTKQVYGLKPTTTESSSMVSMGSPAPRANVTIGNYVIFSVALPSSSSDEKSINVSAAARDMDYTYLTPLAVLNWSLLGFKPILVVTATSLEEILEFKHQLWDIILPKETIVLPLVISATATTNPNNQLIPVTQTIRIYATTILSQHLHDEAFVRITDVDIFLFNPIPFEPPSSASKDSTSNNIDITIYNGKCCLGNNSIVMDGTKQRFCNQYPMHSIGMKVKLWKELFPLSSKTLPLSSVSSPLQIQQDYNDQYVLEIDKILDKSFPGYSSRFIMHGDDKYWYMDQILMGCVIDDVISDGRYRVELQDQELDRLHVGMTIFDLYVEAHLSGFQLSKHHEWLELLIDNSILLMGNRHKYRQYTQKWIDYYDIEIEKPIVEESSE